MTSHPGVFLTWKLINRKVANNPIVENLLSHCIHTMSHRSMGLPDCFPSWGTQVQSPGGNLCETGILLLALSRYIGDPAVIDHCCIFWGGLLPEPSLDRHAANVIIPLDLTQLFCPGFMPAAGPPSSFTADIVGCWGGALWRACYLTVLTLCLTGPTCLFPVMRDPGSISRGVLTVGAKSITCAKSITHYDINGHNISNFFLFFFFSFLFPLKIRITIKKWKYKFFFIL